MRACVVDYYNSSFWDDYETVDPSKKPSPTPKIKIKASEKFIDKKNVKEVRGKKANIEEINLFLTLSEVIIIILSKQIQ